MSDGILYKAFFAIALIMVLVSVLPGFPPNAGWVGLQTTIERGVSLPGFLNPFNGATGAQMFLIPQSNGSLWDGASWNFDPPAQWFNNAPLTVTGQCNATQWWGCAGPDHHLGSRVYTLHGADAYVRLNTTDSQFSVNMTSTLSSENGYPVSSFDVLFQCKTTGSNTAIQFILYRNTGAEHYPVTTNTTCASSGFTNYTATTLAYSDVVGSFSQNTLMMSVTVAPGSWVDISGIELILTYSNAANVCTNDLGGIACQIGNIFTSIVRGFVFFVNGVVFVVTTIVSFATFLFNILTNILLGFFIAVLYFFTLPNMPLVLQAVIDAIMLILILIVILAVADRVIGLFGGFVNKA